MATYKKIVDVETVAEATENMNVLVEENGALKKVPSKEVGGGKSGETVTFVYMDGEITSSHTYQEVYDAFITPMVNGVNGVSTYASAAPSYDYEAIGGLLPFRLLDTDHGAYAYACSVNFGNVPISSGVSTLISGAPSNYFAIHFYAFGSEGVYVYLYSDGNIEYSYQESPS